MTDVKTRPITTARHDVHARIVETLKAWLPARLQALESGEAPLEVSALPEPQDYFLADRRADEILSSAYVEVYVVRRGPRTPVNRPTGTPSQYTWPMLYPVRVVLAFREHGNWPAVLYEGRQLLDVEAGELRAGLYEGALIHVLLERLIDRDAVHDVELAPSDVAPAFFGDQPAYYAVVDLDVVTYVTLPKPIVSGE